MKNTNSQISPNTGRSTQEENAGLSLPQPSLFIFDGNAYRYYNDNPQNIVKNSSDLIARLTSKKFSQCHLLLFPNLRKIIVNTHSSLQRVSGFSYSNHLFSF